MRLDLRKQELPYRDIALVANRSEDAVPVNFAVVCDAPIDEAAAYIPRQNAPVSMTTSFSADRRTFFFSWHPPMTRHTTIWVDVFSKQEIHILHITPVR